MTMMTFPVRARDIIPHRESMLLLDELSFSSSDRMEGRAVIRPDNLFMSKRGLDAVCLVELLAQLAAAGDGYECIRSGRPIRGGFLVGVNDFVVVGAVAAGDALRLELRKGMELNNFTIVEGGVWRGQEQLARGNLKLFILDSETAGREQPGPAESGTAEHGPGSEGGVRRYLRNAVTMLGADSGKARLKITFNSEFPCFHGHFPGYPIVPGVALLQLALVAAEETAACPLTLVGVDRAKFSRQVLPEEPVTAELAVDRDDTVYTIRAGLSIQGKPAASFVLRARARL